MFFSLTRFRFITWNLALVALLLTTPGARGNVDPGSPTPIAEALSSDSIGAFQLSAPAPAAGTNLLPATPAIASVGDTSSSSISTTSSPSHLLVPGTAKAPSPEQQLESAQQRLELARYLRNSRKTGEAETLLTLLMEGEAPERIKRQALLELAAAAQDRNEPARAVQIYAHFLNLWSDDLRAPEILLRQGQMFRQMGINNLALSKFYAVMTSALVLKNDQLEHYERLVARAQTEIAETHYQLGKYSDAAEFYTRLLKQNNPEIDKAQLLYRLVRCTSNVEHWVDAVAHGQDYLTRFPNGPELPEVRFHLALALKQLGHNQESLRQVLTLLQEQRERTRDNPEVWRYWQQRTGNLIANQLYREGDYPKALEIYLDLAQVDSSPEWQVPLWYQIGITYEQLLQPEKASDTYKTIIAREAASGTNASPGLKAVFEMARWRTNFIGWQHRAETVNRSFTNRQP